MKISPEPQYTPEQEILLWAIRVDHTKDQRVTEILTSDIDWNYIHKTAIQHSIVSILYKRLKDEIADLVPEDELSKLKVLFIANTARNIRMTHHLFQIIDVLTDRGVEVIPFKGPALAMQAYGDLSMRSYLDLDILIHVNDLIRTSRLLTDNGYKTRIPIQTSIDKMLLLCIEKDLPFTHDDDTVEIHWKLIERLYAVSLDMDQIWDRSHSILLNGRMIKTLSPEDTIILLCFHGLKHGWKDLAHICDLVHLISSYPDIDWRDVAVRAENIGLMHTLFIGLELAQIYGGISSAFEIMNMVASDPKAQQLAKEFQVDFFQFRNMPYTKPFFYIKFRERFKDKIMFLVHSFTDRILIRAFLKVYRCIGKIFQS